MGMKNAKISPNMANSSFVRINYIHGDEKCKYFAIWRIFPQKNCFSKNHPPPPQKKERKKEKKGAGSKGDERRDVMNGKQSRGVCGSSCGCLLRNMLYGWGAHCGTQFHTPPPLLSLSLSSFSRAQDKTSSAHLTSPQIRFLSFYPVLAPAKNRGSAGEMKRRQF